MNWLRDLAYGIYMALSPREKPSPADIVPTDSIEIDGARITIDFNHLNIPFTKKPVFLKIWEIPDTNSMDGIMDEGNNNLQFQAADKENDKIMVDWMASEWLKSEGLKTCDAVYRIMADPKDDPLDFWKAHLYYAIHRVIEVGFDDEGRYFIFKGTNNRVKDPYKVRDFNILFLSGGVIY